MRLVVLLSLGRHPASGRARLAPAEAEALALARSLAAALPCTGPRALHAGSAAAAGPLGAALGLGAERLDILDIGAAGDPLPALAEALAADPPGLVLAASAAETGAGSGTLPYALAEALGWPLVESVTALAPGASRGRIRMTVAEPGGRRRALSVPVPAIAVAWRGAATAGLAALGPMRRGRVEIRAAASVPDEAAPLDLRTARRRPRRLDGAPRGARDGPEAKAGILRPATPQEAADQIVNYLRAEGLLPSPQPARATREGTP